MRVVTLDRPDPSGWRLSAHLVEVAPGKLLVHSPTWFGESTRAKVEAHGEPVALFAPNHFHHLSLRRYQALWDCPAYASATALPRLRRKGHDIADVADAPAEHLGDVRVVPVPDVKTGEAWLVVPDEDGDTLVVCDAFFNVPGPVTGPKGAVLRWTRTAPGLHLGRTYVWLGIRDEARYRAWVEQTLRELAPTRVLFSHGDPLEGPDCADRLVECMNRDLG